MNVFFSFAVITAQQLRIAAVGASAPVQQQFSQLACIPKACVYALSCQRVHIMGCVTDQCHPLRADLRQRQQAQGKSGGRGDETEFAQRML